MSNITKIIGGLAVAGGIAVVATPVIYQKQIDKNIQQEKQLLLQNNVTVTEKTNKDSFFNIKREYILTLTDVAPIIKKYYPNVRSYDLRDFKKAFDGTQFLVELDFSKFPISHKDAIKISLYKLNDYAQNNLKNDYTGKEILKFIQNKGLEVLIDTNSLDITKARLKDIALTLHKSQNSGDSLNINIANAYTTFGNTIKTNTDLIKFNFYERNSNFTMSLNNIKYDVSKKDDFNYKTNMTINKINFDMSKKSYYSNRMKKTSFALTDFTSSSTAKTIVNTLSISSSSSIKNAKIIADKNNIDINDFKFNFSIDKLDLVNMKKIVALVQNNPNPNPDELVPYIQKIVNNGFIIKINPLSFQKIAIKDKYKNITLEPFTLKFNTTLEHNNLNKYSNPQQILRYIQANLHITTTKSNADMLIKQNPMFAVYLSQISKQNNNKIDIDISFKNGKLTSYGKQIH